MDMTKDEALRMTHNLEATVFVYRNYKDKSIKAEYLEQAKPLGDSPDWEHIATLEPRMWVECHYAAIEQAQKQNIESIALEALEHFYSYGFDRVTCEKAIVAIKDSLPQEKPVAFICQGNVYMADDVDEYCTATHIPLYTKEQL
jgi:hypothetical protein